MKEIYLDAGNCTPLDERVLEKMLPYLKEEFGNPAGLYSLGVRAHQAIEVARKQVSDLIGASPEEIIFTASGSEANNLAIKGVVQAQPPTKKQIIVSAIEHFSVLHPARTLAKMGYDLKVIGVDSVGRVNISELKSALEKPTALVSIQYANSEIGTIQDISEIARLVHSAGSIFHTDAVAIVGQKEIDVKQLGVDLLSLSASQFYGPKGAGALFVRKGIRILPQIEGGIQEMGRRAGLENVSAIVGLGEASRLIKQEMAENNKKIIPLRDRLIEELPKRIDFIYLNGDRQNRLPNNAHFSVEFIEGEAMLLLLDGEGIAVSSGSACTSRALKASHVLSAIGVDAAVAQGSLNFGLTKYNTADDIDYVLEKLPPIVKKLREMSPLWAHFQKTGKRMVAGPGTDYEEHKH